MKNSADHGDDFWSMFPSDGNGGVVLSEPSPADKPAQHPDDEVKAILEAIEHAAA